MKKRRVVSNHAHRKVWSTVGLYALTAVILIFVFGFVYSMMSNYNMGHLQFNDCSKVNPSLKSENYLYFSSVTFYSLGYGDICPVGAGARLVSQIQVALGAIVNTLFIGLIFWKVLGHHLND